MSPFFTSGGKSIGVSASESVLPMNTRDWSPLAWTGWISLQSKGLSRVFSNTTVQKHEFFGAQLSSQSNSHIHTWLLGKTIALTRRTFVGKVMSLLLNMLSRLVITFFPITSWQIYGETMETVTDFIFLGLKITEDGDCSHEIKRCLLIRLENYDQPRQHIEKQRHYLANKGPSSQSYGFSSHLWMWESDYTESWALKNWCFWTVVLQKTLESRLDARRSNQSPLKEISPEYSLGGLMLKLKLQYFGHLVQRIDS